MRKDKHSFPPQGGLRFYSFKGISFISFFHYWGTLFSTDPPYKKRFYIPSANREGLGGFYLSPRSPCRVLFLEGCPLVFKKTLLSKGPYYRSLQSLPSLCGVSLQSNRGFLDGVGCPRSLYHGVILLSYLLANIHPLPHGYLFSLLSR